MKRFIPFLIALLLSACGGEKGPAPVTDTTLRGVGEIPVLHGGRVMPLDTFARLHLLQFSGSRHYGEETAIHWMSRLLFDPETTETDLVFMINHPELLDAIGVEREQIVEGEDPSTRRFSFSHLEPGMNRLEPLAVQARNMEEDDRGLVEKEALRVYSNVLTYRMLSQVFAYARPLEGVRIENKTVRDLMNVPEEQERFTYMGLKDRVGQLTGLMQEAQQEPDPSNWTEEQRLSFALASLMFNFRRNLSDLPLNMLPAAPHGDDRWLAPFDALHDPDGDRKLIRTAREAGMMAQAWQDADWQEVQSRAETIRDFSRSRMDHIRETALTGLEARFNRADYFSKAKVWYILAFFLSFAAILSGRRGVRLAAWVPLLFALLLHLTGLGWRIFLTARPPVTNLYGTFIFVGLVCLFLALLVEAFQKNGLGLFAGSFIAITFLFIADRFAVEGDTMNKVVAVLASNFWLSTHVLAVTTGYAGVWIAGVFGHIWLILRMLGKPSKVLDSVRLPMEGMLGFGLTFAFLGTMLGGVWADQSWGRFWGWDPKENGALLIVLWTAALYHARIGGMIRDLGMAAGTVIGCIMVMLAWLGINLLGVGLHSYGFTNAMQALFFGYIAFETLFLLIVGGIIWFRDHYGASMATG